MTPTVAVVSAGAMGSAVAARLHANGCTVLTNLDGRSKGSHERARLAGMEIVSLEQLVKRADWLLSIVPPDKAESFAKDVFEVYKSLSETSKIRLKFADCNATSPMTVKRIAGLADEYGVPMVDGCIIGGAPRDGYNPTFYASSSVESLLQDFGTFAELGLKVELMEGEGISVGDASALKMSYAGITKGSTGLAITMILAAHASSPATAKALVNEMSHSLPPLLNRFTRSIPDAFPKAYRFEGEMREISDFVNEHLGSGESKIHEGISGIYARIAQAVNDPDSDEIAALREFVEGGKRGS